VIAREAGSRRIALYRVGDAYYATSNLCTHAGALLSAGEVVEGYIECPLHFGLFEIATGRAQGGPVARDLEVYTVRREGTRLMVDVPET
jgi:nitrite reductase/ring-hydroxylating ferredoxin subunit